MGNFQLTLDQRLKFWKVLDNFWAGFPEGQGHLIQSFGGTHHLTFGVWEPVGNFWSSFRTLQEPVAQHLECWEPLDNIWTSFWTFGNFWLTFGAFWVTFGLAFRVRETFAELLASPGSHVSERPGRNFSKAAQKHPKVQN